MKTCTLTDSEVIERLARFSGWSPCQCGNPNCWSAPTRGDQKFLEDIGFLNSLDALQPILHNLHREQWPKLVKELDKVRPEPQDHTSAYKDLMLLPPRTLALAIYEVIGETK